MLWYTNNKIWKQNFRGLSENPKYGASVKNLTIWLYKQNKVQRHKRVIINAYSALEI